MMYDDRLKRLRQARLENGRLRSDLIETYKTVNGNYSINRDLYLQSIGLFQLYWNQKQA